MDRVYINIRDTNDEVFEWSHEIGLKIEEYACELKCLYIARLAIQNTNENFDEEKSEFAVSKIRSLQNKRRVMNKQQIKMTILSLNEFLSMHNMDVNIKVKDSDENIIIEYRVGDVVIDEDSVSEEVFF